MGPTRIFFGGEEILGPKKCLVQKKFGFKTISGPKKVVGLKNNLGPKMINKFESKNFRSNKDFGSENNFGSEKYFNV